LASLSSIFSVGLSCEYAPVANKAAKAKPVMIFEVMI
jgi:hypothetical protein